MTSDRKVIWTGRVPANPTLYRCVIDPKESYIFVEFNSGKDSLGMDRWEESTDATRVDRIKSGVILFLVAKMDNYEE